MGSSGLLEASWLFSVSIGGVLTRLTILVGLLDLLSPSLDFLPIIAFFEIPNSAAISRFNVFKNPGIYLQTTYYNSPFISRNPPLLI